MRSTTPEVLDEDGARALSPTSTSSRQGQPSGYLASAELSAAPAPPRVPRRPMRPPTRGALKHSAAAAALDDAASAQPPPDHHNAAAIAGPGHVPAEKAGQQGAPAKKEEAKKCPTQASLSLKTPCCCRGYRGKS